MKLLQAASTPIAGQPRMPSRACSSAPQFGNTRSGVVVPKTIRSISSAVTPAASIARRAACSAEVDGGLAVGRDVPALDAGALADPGIGGVHRLLEVGVGDDALGQVAAGAGDSRILQGQPQGIDEQRPEDVDGSGRQCAASSACVTCRMRPRSTATRGGRDGARHGDPIGAPMAFYHDAVQADHDGAVVAARVERRADALQHRPREQRRQLARGSWRVNSARSRSVISSATPSIGLQRDIAGEAVGDHDVDLAGEDVVALDETDVAQRRRIALRQRAARAQQRMRRLDRLVALHLLLADVQQADARRGDAVHVARDDRAHDGELLELHGASR